ncbi:MAG TPA: UDP-N-acetylmuramoyl-tripeptide--D-alanyl-D-alanine ligase [Cyclobacteriaceae bacterium]
MDNLIELLYSRFLLSEGVSIDSRKIETGKMFFALRGPNFNGNQYATHALDKGARCVVVDDKDYYLDSEKYILVDDSLKSLQDLARFHRSRFKRPVFGITGSNGKTTTKELINAVLSKKYITVATEGNLNNDIGVALSILNIYPQAEIAVIEMGANAVGDIALLSDITRPTHGLITNIGKAHLEGFGGVEGIIRGKSELFDFLKKHDGQVFINDSDKVLTNMKKRFDKPIFYPDENSPRLIATTPVISYKDKSGGVIETQITGKYNFINMLAAHTVGKYFNVEHNLINEAISGYVPSENRSQIIKKTYNTILMDAYNANPDSMRSAVDNLISMEGKKAVVLGDMLELGVTADEEHEKILQRLNDVDEIFLTGENMYRASVRTGVGQHFESKEALHQAVQKLQGFTVLIKGSRMMMLETVAAHIL